MGNRGIIRRIDSLGRIVMPKEFRDLLGIEENDRLEMVVVDNEIRVKKYIKEELTVSLNTEELASICFILREKGFYSESLERALKGE